MLAIAFLARLCTAAPGEWSFTNSLNVGRFSHTATLLQNGMVLTAAGNNSSGSLLSVEIYDPATHLWSFTGSLTGRRYTHSATLLPSGKVLVAGGYDSGLSDGYLATAELYDPATGTWSPTGSLHEARSNLSAILLNNGKVLVVAGSHGNWLASAELYNPATGIWTTTGSLATGRVFQTATLLPDGKVLVAGGGNGIYYASAELYDPATGIWTATGSLNTGRSLHTATLLQNGMVLIAGGVDGNGLLASAELYNPATGTWSVTGSLSHDKSYHTATLLPNGQVLVAGGSFNRSELYDPATGTWSITGSFNQTRIYQTATLLSDGSVLAAGGQSGVTGLTSAELYGSDIQLPTTVQGRGAFDNQGNAVTFQFQASQGDQDVIGTFSLCDDAAGYCTKRGRVQSLTIDGDSASFSGYVQLNGKRVTFNATITDGSSSGTPDTISISLSNGYSAGGTLTSGDIQIY